MMDFRQRLIDNMDADLIGKIRNSFLIILAAQPVDGSEHELIVMNGATKKEITKIGQYVILLSDNGKKRLSNYFAPLIQRLSDEGRNNSALINFVVLMQTGKVSTSVEPS